MANDTEKILSVFAEMYFYKELVQNRLLFSVAGECEKEVADLLINLGDIIVAVQLKARNKNEKTEDIEKEIKWLNHKCRAAKKQVKKSISFIRNGRIPALENERGQEVSINPNADIIPLVIFMNENIGDNYEHILRKHSEEGMDINCLSFQDFQTICQELLTPIEIVEYLNWRLSFYKNYGYTDISVYIENHGSVVFTRPQSGEALVHHFLAERYGIDNAKDMESYVVPFQWALHNLPNRVTAESVDNSSYPIILFFAHFDRMEIKEFGKRINLSRELARRGEYKIVGTLRNTLRKYVIIFVSTYTGEPLSMDVIEESIHVSRVEFDKLIQVLLYWESAEEYHIDFWFRDASKQYIK